MYLNVEDVGRDLPDSLVDEAQAGFGVLHDQRPAGGSGVARRGESSAEGSVKLSKHQMGLHDMASLCCSFEAPYPEQDFLALLPSMSTGPGTRLTRTHFRQSPRSRR